MGTANSFTENGEIKHRLKRQHTIYLDNEQWEKLKAYAIMKKVSVSELILNIIKEREKIVELLFNKEKL